VEIRSYNDSFLAKQFKQYSKAMKPKQRERLLLAGSKKREYPTKYDDYEDYDI
jgi:hypothetical protein